MDTSSLVSLRLDLPSPAYDAADRRLAFYRQLEDRIGSVPALRAAPANAVPLVGGAGRDVAIAGRPDPTAGPRPRTTVVTDREELLRDHRCTCVAGSCVR